MEQTRICKTCKIEKSFTQYPKNKMYKDGIRPSCVDCRRKIELSYHHKHKHDETSCYGYSKRYDKDKKLKRAFGITLEEYEKMLELQNYECPICGCELPKDIENNRAAPVDHCHTSGAVRGILCKRCNTGLGDFQDNIESLKKAIIYLETNGVDSLVKAQEFIALG